jgi:hypothetical protein
MPLRELVEQIASSYDRTLPMDSIAQRLLRAAGQEVERWIPAGYRCEGSGGKGNGAYCPWIAVLDPDETDTATQGMYVVYLFAPDMKTVTLSLNQGVTELVTNHGRRKARELLREQAAAIRSRFDAEDTSDLESSIDLRSKENLPRDYECGNIFGLTYKSTDLPSEEVMVEDLKRFVRLYAEAMVGREDARKSGNGAIVTTSLQGAAKRRAAEFKPKNDSDYRQSIAAREIVKSRRHETLVKAYGKWLQGRGFVVATNVHPRDMTAERAGQHWLIEAKTVPAGNGVSATREAVGQLLWYAHREYDDPSTARKVALFAESVGDLCTGFLEDLGIAAVWREGGKWLGSPIAMRDDLC